LPPEHPLEAYLSDFIFQYGFECDLTQSCVFRGARYPYTGCIHDAAYLSIALTNGCAEVQHRGPFVVILTREDLSYAGTCMRASENTSSGRLGE
jgi:hypothetical protein